MNVGLRLAAYRQKHSKETMFNAQRNGKLSETSLSEIKCENRPTKRAQTKTQWIESFLK